jgi:high-affinity iron transporter
MGEQVQQGDIPMAALALVVCLSVWREGAEIVLFMYGIISTAEESLINLLIGGAGGATAAAILGTMMYLGLLRVPMKYFFTVTEWMLILVACGLSAQAAGYLTAANILPTLINEMWDSSQLLPETNIIGQILHALIGYTDRPSGMQMVFYLSTLTIIMISARVVNAIHTKPKKEAIIHP